MATKVEGELYYDLDGQLVEIKRQIRQTTGYPFNPYQLKVALQNVIEGKFDGVPKEEPKKHVPLFSVVATTNLGAVVGKKTKKCFTGSRWVYHDSDFDNWLPSDQPKTDACAITTLASARNWTFIEAAVAILGIIGIDGSTNIATIGKLLIENGHTITLAQAEEMVERTESGEETKMRTDGYGNFFFVETGDSKDPVSVGSVSRDGRDWDAVVDPLGGGVCRWRADYRLLVRNLDTLKL